MRILVAAMLLALAIVRPVAADEPADSVQAVIERQIDAFQRNDLAEAFGYAAPGIQSTFRTPENFGRMVETGYPMVWRPARYSMLDLSETPDGLMQTVLFEDRNGRLHEAAYLMLEVDGAWRIAGVWLTTLPGVGT
jgi:hypothetical protein